MAVAGVCGKRILILGASCELGLSLGEALLKAGADVVGTFRSTAGKRRIDERWAALGGHFRSIFLDLADAVSVEALDRALGAPLHGLVDFAQEDFEGLVASVDSTAARGFFDAQIGARHAVLHHACRAMLLTGQGRLLYVSSAAVAQPNPGQGFYAAAKSAGEALYRAAGLELCGRGITSIILRPGFIDCGRGRRFLQNKHARKHNRKTVRQVLAPSAVVRKLLSLLSDRAVTMNATVADMGGVGAVGHGV